MGARGCLSAGCGCLAAIELLWLYCDHISEAALLWLHGYGSIAVAALLWLHRYGWTAVATLFWLQATVWPCTPHAD